MFSLHVSLTGFAARLLRVFQRPVRSATSVTTTSSAGELLSIDPTSHCSTQTLPLGESVVHITGEPSLLPTTPPPAYTTRANTACSSYYGDILGYGMLSRHTASASNPSSARRTFRSLVRWGGRDMANDVEMQLPVSFSTSDHANMSVQSQPNERPPTYAEIDGPAASQVAPRRRGAIRATVVFVLSAIIAIVITLAIMKKANAI